MNFLSRHSHHLVEESPWPLMASSAAMFLVSGILSLFYDKSVSLLSLSFLSLSLISYQWWRDITVESSTMGLHNWEVESGLRMGMLLFITSEVFLFLSFFWAYFHGSLAPEIETGSSWPPVGINSFNVFEVPLLNTLVLLSSGVTLTWSHHLMLSRSDMMSKALLELTVVLGGYFTALQAMEYYEASFTIADSLYGSVFFLATGFHGAHVLIGTTFLLICLVRMVKGHFSSSHHFGFEAAAWYWHFVDVVWLFLFVSIYWWGG